MNTWDKSTGFRTHFIWRAILRKYWVTQTYLDSALNLLDVPMWNCHLWGWKCTSDMLSVWRIYYGRFKTKKTELKFLPFSEQTRWARSNGRNSPRSGGRNEPDISVRAKITSTDLAHLRAWLLTSTRWIHLLFSMSFLLCRSAVNDSCCRFLLFSPCMAFRTANSAAR